MITATVRYQQDVNPQIEFYEVFALTDNASGRVWLAPPGRGRADSAVLFA